MPGNPGMAIIERFSGRREEGPGYSETAAVSGRHNFRPLHELRGASQNARKSAKYVKRWSRNGGKRKTPPFAGAKRRGRNREEAVLMRERIMYFPHLVKPFLPLESFFSPHSGSPSSHPHLDKMPHRFGFVQRGRAALFASDNHPPTANLIFSKMHE
jgi:hypothetical protein